MRCDSLHCYPRLNHARANVPGERSKSTEPDVTLQIRYAPIIAQAIRTPVADTEAVKAAQKMLALGELDSPAIIRQAAENMVDSGI